MSEENNAILILVVDDHEPAANMLSRLFSSRGYRSECAYNGIDALELAQRLRPDLILLDIMMPGMDGFEVLTHLRQNPATARIPTIFITAKDDTEAVEHGLQLGADDYIPKPVKPRELIARAESKIRARELELALEQRTRDLEALLRLSEELNNHLTVEDLIQLVLYLALDLIPTAQAAIIYRFGGVDEILDKRTTKKNDAPTVEFDDAGLLQAMPEHGKTLYWSGANLQLSNFSDGLAVWLAHGESIQGILVALSNQPFTEHHQRLFEGASRQIALAIRNAELYAVQQEYTERLEEMVEERTKELRDAQDLLVRSEKLASIGRLAAGIAHEINNPLLPIRVNLELMREDVEDGNPVSLEDIDQSLHSVKRISRIVEQLQEFTRKSSDKMPPMTQIHIAAALESVLALSRTYIRKSGVEIEMDIDREARIYGNRDQLEQVFLNLILNAQAAMNSGGLLRITSYVEGKTIYVQFTDTGHGIAADIKDKIFEPFVTTKADGSGLGLFISHTVIENHSGEIIVESEEGAGATFTLSLPIITD